jgi:protein phosphatase
MHGSFAPVLACYLQNTDQNGKQPISQNRERIMQHVWKNCLKRIFMNISDHHRSPAKGKNGETIVLQPAYTRRLKPGAAEERYEPRQAAPFQEETSIAWCGLTDNGRVRTHNEDYFSCIDLREGSLFLVADGMGGHDAGEVASRIAGEGAAREIRRYAGTGDPATLLELAVQQANADVLKEATSRGSNMGTTLNMALVAGDSVHIANVGDSRSYWIENGSIKRITEDHSLVEKLVSLGKLTRDEARNHPKSNVLYRTIGSEGPLKVDLFQVPLSRGGSLLLCTDGLWGEVSDEAIHTIFTSEKDVKKICARLITKANGNGGKDNITVIVMKVV